MKVTIRSILGLLEKERFNNEQHVRFSLVARICKKLDWDIWNPYEFDTEDPAKKFTLNENGIAPEGKIDIALYKTTMTSRTAHVFIEVKKVGKLEKELQKSRDQLEQYSLRISPPLSVLTDGLKWEFFLNCLKTQKGKYSERLINSFNLSEDDLDAKCTIISFLLNSSTTKTNLETVGKKMRKEYEIIQLIQGVKPKAISLFPGEEAKQILAASELIKEQHNIRLKYGVIVNLWNKTLALGGLDKEPEDTKAYTEIKAKQDEINTGKKIKAVSILGQTPIRISSYGQLKQEVYNFIIANKANFSPEKNTKTYGIHPDPVYPTRALPLDDGRFIDGNVSADMAINHCQRILEEAGYSKHDFALEYKE